MDSLFKWFCCLFYLKNFFQKKTLKIKQIKKKYTKLESFNKKKYQQNFVFVSIKKKGSNLEFEINYITSN